MTGSLDDIGLAGLALVVAVDFAWRVYKSRIGETAMNSAVAPPAETEPVVLEKICEERHKHQDDNIQTIQAKADSNRNHIAELQTIQTEVAKHIAGINVKLEHGEKKMDSLCSATKEIRESQMTVLAQLKAMNGKT